MQTLIINKIDSVVSDIILIKQILLFFLYRHNNNMRGFKFHYFFVVYVVISKIHYF
jgi:hypothetical protein